VAKILDKENHQVGVKRQSDSDYPANISGKIPKWIHVDSVTEKRKITDCQGTSNEEEFEDKWMTFIDIEDHWSSTNQDREEKEASHFCTKKICSDIRCNRKNSSIY